MVSARSRTTPVLDDGREVSLAFVIDAQTKAGLKPDGRGTSNCPICRHPQSLRTSTKEGRIRFDCSNDCLEHEIKAELEVGVVLAPSRKPAPIAKPHIAAELDVTAPFGMAQRYLLSRVDGDAIPDLRFWQGEFWRARVSHYEVWPNDSLRAGLYPWLERHQTPAGEFIKPNKAMVERIIDGLKAAAHFDDVSTAPAWIGSDDGFAAGDLIACQNGLLHVPTRKLLAPSRRFFTLNALSFRYEAEASRPGAWLEFLRDLWEDDTESIETLQEMLGLLITSDTQHQKAFLIVGPQRSGKGTMGRVIVELVGRANVTAPMLSSLGQQFGLESMIGKTVALISDARLGGRADVSAIVENILRITGEDAVSVPRKFKTDWTAPLKARFVILTNELPPLLDQSGALVGRFVLLRLTKTFVGKEDLGLTGRLMAELPGILLWALEGLDRLRARGHFRQPTAARAMLEQLQLMASPAKAFVQERCFVAPGVSIECGELYKAWCTWSTEQGRDHAGTAQSFGRNLAAALPAVKQTQVRTGDRRVRQYEGVRLRSIVDPEETVQ